MVQQCPFHRSLRVLVHGPIDHLYNEFDEPRIQATVLQIEQEKLQEDFDRLFDIMIDLCEYGSANIN